MIKGIARFFRESIGPQETPAADRPHGRQLAICALLLEAAHADEEFSDDEHATVLGMVRDRFDLDRDRAEELIALAEEERDRSTDLYQFTQLIDDSFTRIEKLEMLEELWRVVYADGVLDAHEDALMHKLANLLGLKHRELIALKLRVKGELEG